MKRAFAWRRDAIQLLSFGLAWLTQAPYASLTASQAGLSRGPLQGKVVVGNFRRESCEVPLSPIDLTRYMLIAAFPMFLQWIPEALHLS